MDDNTSINNDLFSDLLDIGHEDLVHTDRTKIVKAAFGWTGGKFNSLKYLLPGIDKRLTTKWIDVFGGSGIVSWNVKEVQLMVFNDAYSGVVDFYKILQSDRYEELVEYMLKLTPPYSREEWISARANWCDETDTLVRAAKWYYMVNFSTIAKGQSFGRVTNSKISLRYPDSSVFRNLHWKLRKFILENLDFKVCIKDYASVDAVLYYDPPYINTDGGIYKHKFTKDDMNDLLRLIDSQPGTHILSGYPNEMIDDACNWTKRLEWDVRIHAEVKAYREENNKKDKVNVQSVGLATEVLWLKENV